MQLKKVVYISIVALFLNSLNAFSADKKIVSSIYFENKNESNNKIYKSIEKIFNGVKDIRKLPLKKAVKVGVKTSAQVNEFLNESIKKEYPEKDIKKDYLLLKKLGLIKKDVDLKKIFLDLYTQQIAGFYDEKTQAFYVVNNGREMSDLESSIVISHELVHALQDQSFGIKNVMKDDKNGDTLLARSALIEGEATFASTQYIIESLGLNRNVVNNVGEIMKKSMTPSAIKTTTKVPGFMLEQMFFPYIEGTKFSEAIYKNKGNWDKFNSIYKHLPVSTEQIMHPEKYLANEEPIKIHFDKELIKNKDWKLLDCDTFGEFSLLNYFMEYNSEKKSQTASTGWGGDTYALFSKNDDEVVFVYKSIWDTPNDAKEFFETITETLKKRHKSDIKITKNEGDSFTAETKEGNIYITFKDNQVNFADGFDETIKENIVAYLSLSK